MVNGVPKRMVDFAGNFKTVLFGPWDMDLVTESPSIRRKFLDNVLSQTDSEYRRSRFFLTKKALGNVINFFLESAKKGFQDPSFCFGINFL